MQNNENMGAVNNGENVANGSNVVNATNIAQTQTVNAMSQAPKKLDSLENLLKRALARTKDRWLTTLINYIPMVLLTWLVVVVILLLVGVPFIGILVSLKDTSMAISVGILGVILFILVLAFIGGVAKLILVSTLIEDKSKIDFKTVFNKALNLAPAFVWMSVLLGLLVFGAFIPFLIPGYIVLFLSLFATFVFVEEGKRGMKAIGRSMELIQGEGWTVFIYVVVVSLLWAVMTQLITGIFGGHRVALTSDQMQHLTTEQAVNLIISSMSGVSNIVIQVLSWFWSIFMMSFMYEMYVDLKKHLPDSQGNIPAVLKIMAVVGWMIVIGLFTMFLSGAFS